MGADSDDAIFMTACDGTFVDVNCFALELFGFRKEDMMGKSVLELYADPEDRARFRSEVEKAGAVMDFEIADNKSVLYSPEVVESCIKIFEEDKFKFAMAEL
jgi:PAS domain S-box-containing protein